MKCNVDYIPPILKLNKSFSDNITTCIVSIKTSLNARLLFLKVLKCKMLVNRDAENKAKSLFFSKFIKKEFFKV